MEQTPGAAGSRSARADAGEGAGPRETIASLERENASLRARVAELERLLGLPASPEARPPAPPTSSSTSPPPAPPTSPPPTPSPTPSEGATREESAGLEQFVGRRVVPLVGGAAVLLAVGILVHYTIDLGLFGRLPPAARFSLGLAIGLALLGLGELVRRRGAPGASVGLDAAGIGSVLATIAIGVFGLRLFGPATGSALSAAAGVLGAAWSLRSRSEVVGIAALLGIFAMPLSFGVFQKHESPILGGLLVALGIATGLAMHLVAGNAFVRVRLCTLVATVVTGLLATWHFDDARLSSGFILLWWALFVASAVLCALRGTGVVGAIVAGTGPMPGSSANGAVVAMASVPLVFAQLLGRPGGGVVDVVDLLPILAGAILAGVAIFLRSFGAIAPDEDAELRQVIESSATDGPEVERALRVRATSGASLALARDAEALAVLLGALGIAFVSVASLRPMALALGAAAALVVGVRAGRPLVAAMASILSVAALGAILMDGRSFFDAPKVASFAVPFTGGLELVAIHASPAVCWGFGAALTLLAAGIFVGRGFLASWTSGLGAILWILASIALLHRVGPIAAIAIPAIVVALLPRSGVAGTTAALALAVPGFLLWLGFTIAANLSEQWRSPVGLGWEFIPTSTALVLGALRLGSPLRPGESASAIRLIPVALASLMIGIGLAFLGSLGALRSGYGGFDAAIAASAALAVAATVASTLAQPTSSVALAGAGATLAVASASFASLLGFAILFDAASGALATTWLAIAAIVGVGGAAFSSFAAIGDSARWAQSTIVAVGASSVAPLGALAFASASGGHLGAWVAGGWIVTVGAVALAAGFRSDLAALRWAGLATLGILVLRLYFVDLATSPILVRVALLLVAGLALVGTGIIYARRGTSRR